MKISKQILENLIREELNMLFEVDPTADPELTDPDAGTEEGAAEEEARKAAQEDPLVKKGSGAVETMRSPEQYAELLKNVLLGSRLSATMKKQAFQSLFGDQEGLKIFALLSKAAPGLAK
jgi:hypothetical protein